MHTFIRSLLPAVLGTVAMTSFSKLLSTAMKENYSEPDHLCGLIERLFPMIKENNAQMAGWASHLLAGLSFTLAYVKAWKSGAIKENAVNSASLGVVNGLIGIIMWKLSFKIYKFGPSLDTRNYYLQLIPAHIIFSLFVLLTDRLQKRISENTLPRGNSAIKTA